MVVGVLRVNQLSLFDQLILACFHLVVEFYLLVKSSYFLWFYVVVSDALHDEEHLLFFYTINNAANWSAFYCGSICFFIEE